MTFWIGLALFAGGYAASIYTWDHVHTWVVGVETKIRALEDKAKALRSNLKTWL